MVFFLPLLYSTFIFNRAIYKCREWWIWMTISLLIGVSAASKLIFGCSFACPYNDAPAEGTDGFTFWWTAYYITLILTLVSKYTDLLWIYIYGEAVIEKKANSNRLMQRARHKGLKANQKQTPMHSKYVAHF